jgi:hypothetical protein
MYDDIAQLLSDMPVLFEVRVLTAKMSITACWAVTPCGRTVKQKRALSRVLASTYKSTRR